eukprot:TRINITY_DN21794_c0_g1_i6.p1 TRINITY_DN21794_c0_g1~~TRINITY_DN21794_c0_g1_i6.p1  ORF type:complete len:127 (-),score=9.79 TRINITY_DN21794_c0_g1_i6:287-667(-)
MWKRALSPRTNIPSSGSAKRVFKSSAAPAKTRTPEFPQTWTPNASSVINDHHVRRVVLKTLSHHTCLQFQGWNHHSTGISTRFMRSIPIASDPVECVNHNHAPSDTRQNSRDLAKDSRSSPFRRGP